MKSYKKEIQVFRIKRGILRTKEAIKSGISPRELYGMRDKGIIQELSRGLYKLSSDAPVSNPDFVIAGMKIPQGVICLLSALSYHNITAHIPNKIDIALKKGATKPRLQYPPINYYWFSERSFKAGVETYTIDKKEIKIYSPEKTVADCFKFRNRVGLDAAVEALRLCRSRKRCEISTLMKYAEICRVANIIQPYLEAIS